MNKEWVIAVATVAGFVVLITSMNKAHAQVTNSYIYSVDAGQWQFGCKYWTYIEPLQYNILLNSGDSVNITISYPSNQQLDIVDIRFHNIGGMSDGYGKIYSFVNGKYALPTIGITNTQIPMYIGFPKYPTYGTQFVTTWDTDDTRGNGTFNYKYVYEGDIPLYVKTLELYIAKT